MNNAYLMNGIRQDCGKRDGFYAVSKLPVAWSLARSRDNGYEYF
jgi:hypothetical protein